MADLAQFVAVLDGEYDDQPWDTIFRQACLLELRAKNILFI
jgi:hypothetical protein